MNAADPRKDYVGAKEDMLAMLDLGIHPMQRYEGRVHTHDPLECGFCGKKFETLKSAQGHKTYCQGNYVPPPSRRKI